MKILKLLNIWLKSDELCSILALEIFTVLYCKWTETELIDIGEVQLYFETTLQCIGRHIDWHYFV